MNMKKFFAPAIALVTCVGLASTSFAAGVSGSAHGVQSGLVHGAETAQNPGYHPDCWPASVAAVAAVVVAVVEVAHAVTSRVITLQPPAAAAAHNRLAIQTAATRAFDRQ